MADKNIDLVDKDYKPISAIDEKTYQCCKLFSVVNTMTMTNWYKDDPEIYDGAHVGLQVVGRRFQEEKVLALTEILGDALGKNVV